MQSYNSKYCKLQHLIVVVITATLDTDQKSGSPCFWQESNHLPCSATDTDMHPYSSKHVWHFFIIKPTRCTNFTNLFWHETTHVSDSSSVHHQEFIHCTLSNGICHTGLLTAFEQDQDGTAIPSWSCSKAVYKPVWHISLLSVQWMNSWWWTQELSETCSFMPK